MDKKVQSKSKTAFGKNRRRKAGLRQRDPDEGTNGKVNSEYIFELLLPIESRD
jgi:hypothetical protein